ncbi:MAG TPA: hypothetical protein VGL19_13520 [Polyangiaceae bacterium]
MVEQGVFGGAAGGVENEIGSVRTPHSSRSINQAALFGTNADIQRLAGPSLRFVC